MTIFQYPSEKVNHCIAAMTQGGCSETIHKQGGAWGMRTGRGFGDVENDVGV